METLTRDRAAEFGPGGVRVNAISPGVIRDPRSGEGSPEGAEAAMRGTPPSTSPATKPPSSTAPSSTSMVDA
jgi:NAD(P)-dependent dehydrogenase (short-subunit alcohol dehydrogenase family)